MSHVSYKQAIMIITGTIGIESNSMEQNRCITLMPNYYSPRQTEAEMAHHWAHPMASNSAIRLRSGGLCQYK